MLIIYIYICVHVEINKIPRKQSFTERLMETVMLELNIGCVSRSKSEISEKLLNTEKGIGQNT